jgi:hypothetical protein
LDPVALKPRRAFTTHLCDERGKRARAIAHQRSGGCRLSPIECILNRDQGGAQVVFVRLGSCAHRGVHPKDALVHQSIDAGQQERSALWLLRGALIPQGEPISAQDARKGGADPD